MDLAGRWLSSTARAATAPEGLSAEAARQGRTDVSLVSVDSTIARAHHDAAGMLVGKDVMEALDEAAAEQEQARQKGGRRGEQNGWDDGNDPEREERRRVRRRRRLRRKPCSAGPAAD